jgi:predicted PurR-regulated permease PerM
MLPDYAEEFNQIAASIGSWLKGIGVGPEQVEQVKGSFDPATIAGFFSNLAGGVASITAALVIVLTMLILMSADATYVPTILGQVGLRRPRLADALIDYARNVRRYMVVTTFLGLVQGAINGIALWLLHVPAALLWAVLAFLCSYIPNIGYFIAIIPPLIFGYFVGGWGTLIAVLVIYAIVNAVVQSIVQPRVVGNAVALSQSLTFFSVLFWAIIIGPIGAVLAIPLTLLVRAILIDSDPDARWWRPALGDVTETRAIMTEADERAKASRRGARQGHDEPQRVQPDGIQSDGIQTDGIQTDGIQAGGDGAAPPSPPRPEG